MDNQTIGGSSLTLLQKSLDALWMRQKAISDNIANIDTPGYKKKSVVFENVLEKAISGGQDFTEKLNSLSPKMEESSDTSLREDGNNVDIDEENIELARSVLQYQSLSAMTTSEISRLKYVITEGKG